MAAIGAAVPEDERKSVYFEISAAPYCYSFGEGVFLDEMLELIGADNVLAGQEGWVLLGAACGAAAVALAARRAAQSADSGSSRCMAETS